MSVKTMKGNKATSKEIQEVLKMYPKAFSVNIPVTNKGFYNIIGANKVSGKGLLDNSLSAKVFTVDILDWEGKKDDQKTANYFGFESIMILHDPNVKAKKAEKTSEEKLEGETK